jgi:hypothetical protein
VARTTFVEAFGQFSPNGEWVAYQSNESGRPEVYAQPFSRSGSQAENFNKRRRPDALAARRPRVVLPRTRQPHDGRSDSTE